MKKIFFVCMGVLSMLYGFGDEKFADCLILQKENTIICKYNHKAVSYDKNITVNWLDPKGKISRTRNMTIPAGHGSIYDYRYISGREHGVWIFEVIDKEVTTTTKFTLPPKR